MKNTLGDTENADRISVGKSEEKTLLGRKRRIFENDMKMDLQEIEYNYVNLINQNQNVIQWWDVKTVLNIWAQ
jgi:hypothetical protein